MLRRYAYLRFFSRRCRAKHHRQKWIKHLVFLGLGKMLKVPENPWVKMLNDGDAFNSGESLYRTSWREAIIVPLSHVLARGGLGCGACDMKASAAIVEPRLLRG